ncbi:hypothetical protein B0H13DRAFT_1025943 [Mycena leptocephala]|nr:hypothetical protein B0H13DRAFT_1025943 [Mycena leptocephala]
MGTNGTAVWLVSQVPTRTHRHVPQVFGHHPEPRRRFLRASVGPIIHGRLWHSYPPRAHPAGRFAHADGKELEDLPDAPWQESSTIHEREAHELHDESRDPRVLHMIVLDRTGGDLARLKDNLALAFLYAEQLNVNTPRAFVASEIRRLLDAGAAPDFGVADAGLMGIACGAIEVGGESFRQFRQRCVALVETLADADLVTRWGLRSGSGNRKVH